MGPFRRDRRTPRQPERSRRRRSFLLITAGAALETVPLWQRGYGLGGNVVVRCSRGHLYTTLWIPGVSLKALRFVWWRLERCPVAHHWAFVRPVRESELSEEGRRAAREHRGIRIP